MEAELAILNEWWKTGKVAADRLKEYKRECYKELKSLLAYRQIVVLTGLRRVGKSTLLFQLIQDLIGQGIPPKHIVYHSYDDRKETIIEVLDSFQKITKTKWKEEKIFVFLDEIQKLRDWSSKLKILYDNFPRVKFFVSGSASLQLEKEAIHNLAGRYFALEVPPLSIKEYYELKENAKIDNLEIYKNELAIELDDYLRKPFPEIVSWSEERRVFEYIKESIVAKIMKIDLPDTFENVNTKLLETLLDIFYSEPGMILNLDSLSRSLRIHKKTLEQHIFFLEFSKLITIVKNFRVSILAESRKLRKVYPYHISLAFPSNIEIQKGKIAECAVQSKANAKLYWRKGNKEVDFILRQKNTILPIEVKYKKILDQEDIKTLSYFMKKFGINKSLVIYVGETKEIGEGIKAVNLVSFLFSDIEATLKEL